MQFPQKAFAVVSDIVLVLFVLAVGVWMLKMVEPLSPVITVSLVLLGTLVSLEKRTTAILTIGGLILYAASWPAVEVWGLWWGMSVWTLGVLSWIVGVFRPLPYLQATTS